jgi:ribosomal protein S27E
MKIKDLEHYKKYINPCPDCGNETFVWTKWGYSEEIFCPECGEIIHEDDWG